MADENKKQKMEKNKKNLMMIKDKLKEDFKNGCNKILLINPPETTEEDFNLDKARKKIYPSYPPYWAGVLRNVLTKRDYKTEIIDLNYEILSSSNNEYFRYSLWQDKLKEKIDNFKPDIVGISCMYSLSEDYVKRIANLIKQKNLPVIVGGSYTSLIPEDILKCEDIDYVMTHESEISFPNMLDFINGKGSYKDLGQIYTQKNNEIISVLNIKRPELEEFVSPEYGDLPIDNYSSVGIIGAYEYMLKPNTKCGTVLSSKGCRGHCSFCATYHLAGKPRKKPIKKIVDEIEQTRDKYGIRHFMWLDDDLFFNKEFALNLFNEIHRRNLGVTWDASNGVVAASIDDEIIDACVRSGCIGLHIGIESGNPYVLRHIIHKPSRVEDFLRTGEILNKYPQIFTKGFLMIGFPGETIGQMKDTLNLAKQMDLDWYPVQTVAFFPMTEITRKMMEIKKINEEQMIAQKPRYPVGSTGEQAKYEDKIKLRKEVENPLEKDCDHIPTEEELKDIWFFIDYEVNYKRILTQNNSDKIFKKKIMLENVYKKRALNNPLPKLFLGILEEKIGNHIKSKEYFELARQDLKVPLWDARFKKLGLYKLMNLEDGK